MSLGITLATALRVLRQIRRDPRTIALVLVVPPALLALLREVFDGRPEVFQAIGAPMIGLIPFLVMFLVTSIAMLRERTSGTLERLMSMPIGKLDLLAGYGLAFAFLAALQAAVTSAVGFGLLSIDTAGPVWVVTILAIGNAVLGTATGLFLSAFASTEFQAVQFLPATVLPQLFVAGLFAPRSTLPGWLGAISDVLPLTYAYDALARVSAGGVDAKAWRDVAIIVAFTVVALSAGAATLRRRTA
jgi:ABC-2 type transport system permease protein